MSEPEQPAGESKDRLPIPPATFEYLTWSLRMQAELNLGLLHGGGDEGLPDPDFDLARHFIDLMAMLQDKTKGNLTMEEQRRLENALTELRFRYVQAIEQGKSASPETKQE